MLIRHDDLARCPNCGQHLAPRAGGCWLCGASLDPARSQRRAGPLERAVALWRGLLGRRS
jgi:predicted amidophosphoribosyltransferase